jgi:hypothetical protein
MSDRTASCGHACAALVGLALVPGVACAAEGFRLRAPVAGVLGAEIGAPLQAPGFFGSATLGYGEVRRVVDDSGNTLTTAPVDVPLPTGAPTSGAIPNGTFRLHVPAGTVNLKQRQTQLNLAAGYLTGPDFAGGSLLFRATLPLIHMTRDFSVSPTAAAGIVPTPSSPPLSRAGLGVVNAAAAAANAQVQTLQATTSAMQNDTVSGLGDVELAAAWRRGFGRTRVLAGAALYLPTGAYDANRGPNPGFGDFRTLQLGVGAVHPLDNGLTLAARASWGTNTTNRATHYRSGDFAVLEGALRKDWRRLGAGVNLVAIRQIEDDRLNGVTLPNLRLRNNAAGPFVSWRLSRDTVLTLQHSRTFGGRNAQVSNTTFVRVEMGTQ